MEEKHQEIQIPVTVGGVRFKNPFYVASGPTTKSVRQLKRIEETGWAAASIKLSIDPRRTSTGGRATASSKTGTRSPSRRKNA
jgi:dihydroorotate dehydrogenase